MPARVVRDGDHLNRFAWEDALRTTHGLPEAVTRLVLYAISSYCMRKGDPQCWPSLTALETATGLSKPTLIDHINRAVALGWLRKETGQMKGMKRRGSIYTLTAPTGKASVDRSTTRQQVKPDLTGQQPRPVKQTPPTGKADGVQPVKRPTMETLPELEVSTTSSSEGKGNINAFEVENQKSKSNVNGPDINPVSKIEEKTLEGLAAWIAETNFQRLPDEHDIPFTQRASVAWIAERKAAKKRYRKRRKRKPRDSRTLPLFTLH